MRLTYFNNLSIFLFLSLLTGCSTLPKAIKPSLQINPIRNLQEIYIVNHGWHTGLIINADSLNNLIPSLKDRFDTTAFYEIGWGDTQFYLAREISSGMTLRAIFWPTETVLHIVGLSKEPHLSFRSSRIKRISIEYHNFKNLLQFIENSFLKNSDMGIIHIKRGLYGNSRFYEARGSYHLFNTCNKWTAKALYSAGLDINPAFYFSAGGIMDFLDSNLEVYMK
jgi:uncharacterized protein (TIGR02117 family)